MSTDPSDAVQAQERQLRLAQARAEEGSRARIAFLANMSHEIRTPLTAILGFAETLGERLTGHDLELVRIIQRNGEQLVQLISDVLDIALAESGSLPINVCACDATRVLTDISDRMRIRAEGKGVAFCVEIDADVPHYVRADPVRWRQVLQHLIDNAVKFTDRGRVSVRLAYEPSEPSGALEGQLVCTIGDSGTGMSAGQIEFLTRPFSQGDASMVRRHGGAGLGLALSKSICTLMGGSLELSSRLGKGTTATVRIAAPAFSESEVGATSDGVRIPLHTSTSADRPPELPKLSGRILVAEDGPDNRRLLAFILKAAGASVTMAVDGEEAVRAVTRAAEEGEPFDAILMDMYMPVMDGYLATRLLRERGCMVPIVAVTAHALRGDREKCLEVGCSDFCTKPINRHRLLDMLSFWMNRQLGTAITIPPETDTEVC